MGKDPAMPFYVNDWLSSPRVQAMTQLQELAYFRLLAFCWASGDASIPDDDKQLAILSRMGEGWFDDGSLLVRKCFEPHPLKSAHLTNARVFELWKERQEWRDKSSRGGRKSGRIRRLRRAKGGSTKREPNANSSSSSSSSSNSKDTNVSLPPLPPVLNNDLFRAALARWLGYKRERRESYKPEGLAALIRAAEKRTASHGIEHVSEAMDSAMANGWEGWNQSSLFGGRNGAQPRHNTGRPAGDTGRGSL